MKCHWCTALLHFAQPIEKIPHARVAKCVCVCGGGGSSIQGNVILLVFSNIVKYNPLKSSNKSRPNMRK